MLYSQQMKLPIPRKENHSHRLPSERFDDFAVTFARSVIANGKKTHILLLLLHPLSLKKCFIIQ